MKNKLIISESQFYRLKLNLKENSPHSVMVEQIKNELDSNYEIVEKFIQNDIDYTSKIMFKIKVSEEIIDVNDLITYMVDKHNVSEGFMEQLIKDWVDNKISSDNQLSKNVLLRNK